MGRRCVVTFRVSRRRREMYGHARLCVGVCLSVCWPDCKLEGPLFSAEFVCLSVCLSVCACVSLTGTSTLQRRPILMKLGHKDPIL